MYAIHTGTHAILTYDIKEHTLYISSKNGVGRPLMKSENKLTFPTCARVAPPSRRCVTKDDARDPSKRHAISWTFNTTLGKPLRHHTLNCE